MRNILLAATILTAIGSEPANAQLRVALSVGGSSFACADGSVCDLDAAANALIFGSQSLNGVTVLGTFASSSLSNPDTLNISNLLITNTTNAVKTLFMAVSDNNYVGDEHCIMTAVSGTWNGNGPSTAQYSFFLDGSNIEGAANSKDGPGTFISSDNDSAGSGPVAFSFDGDDGFFHGTPFSITEVAVFKLAPGAQLVGNSIGVLAVPETSTWAMLLIGSGLLGLFSSRKINRCMNV